MLEEGSSYTEHWFEIKVKLRDWLLATIVYGKLEFG